MGQHCWRRVGWRLWCNVQSGTEGRNQIFEATQLPRINENLKGSKNLKTGNSNNAGLRQTRAGLRQWRVGLMLMPGDTLAGSRGVHTRTPQGQIIWQRPARRRPRLSKAAFGRYNVVDSQAWG